MSTKTILLLAVIAVAIACIHASPSQCPTQCTADAACCQIGGCYDGRCVECRTPGMVCQRDDQCCETGGCYLRSCVNCRSFGVTCQAHHHCCSGFCNALGNCGIGNEVEKSK